jgi:hypothetical protein
MFHRPKAMTKKHPSILNDSKAKGEIALDKYDLTPLERAWARRCGEELIARWTKGLSKRLKPGISFKAVPAVFAYGLAVMKFRHREIK